MTISTTAYAVTLGGNGSTTVFNFSFVADNPSTIQVIYTDANGVQTILSSGLYTLVINAVPVGGLWGIGGTVTYPLVGSPILSGTSLTILRDVPYTQSVSIANQGAFYPQAVEQGLDLLELQIQQVQGATASAIQAPPADGVINMTLPAAAARADKFLFFDINGLPVAVSSIPSTSLIGPATKLFFLSAYTSLASADAAASTAGGVLVVDENVTLISNASLSSPQILFAGGKITRGTNTLSGNFAGTMSQIFDTQTSTSGLVTFTNHPEFISPQMWGAVDTVGNTTNSYYALQIFATTLSTIGGRGVMRGSYYYTGDTSLFFDAGANLKYHVDAAGASLRTTGACFAITMRSLNNSQGTTFTDLLIDHSASSSSTSLGGFNIKAGIQLSLQRCAVQFKGDSVSASYLPYKIESVTPGVLDSLWTTLIDCSSYNTVNTKNNAAIGVYDISNSLKIVRPVISGSTDGIFINSLDGDPNSIVIDEPAFEVFINGIHVNHTGTKFISNLTISDGWRCEPGGTGYLFYVTGSAIVPNASSGSVYSAVIGLGSAIGTVNIFNSIPSGMYIWYGDKLICKGSNMYPWSSQQSRIIPASTTGDIYRFIDAFGDVVGNEVIAGTLYLFAYDGVHSNYYSASYEIETTGNSVTNASITGPSANAQTRGANPLNTNPSLAADGVLGSVKVQVQAKVTGDTTVVCSFVGTVF
jgi:hypothetical protein